MKSGILRISIASEKCQQEKRKTVNGEDILFAMTSLGFENYAEALKIYLAKYREVSSHISFQLYYLCLCCILIFNLLFIRLKAIFLWIRLISEHRPSQQEERISKTVLVAKALARPPPLAHLEQIRQLEEISTRPRVQIIFLAVSKQKPESMIQVGSEACTAPVCREGIMVQLEERATRTTRWILRLTLLIKLFQGGLVSERTAVMMKVYD